MTPRKPPRPGGRLSAADLAHQYGETQRLANLTASPPLEVLRQGTGLHLRWAGDAGFWALITDRARYDDGVWVVSAGAAPDAPPELPFEEGVYYYSWRRVLVDAAADYAETDPPFRGGVLVIDEGGDDEERVLQLPAVEVNNFGFAPGQVVWLRKGVADGGEHFLFAASSATSAPPGDENSFDIVTSWRVETDAQGNCTVVPATTRTITGVFDVGEEVAV